MCFYSELQPADIFSIRNAGTTAGDYAEINNINR